MGLGSTFMTLFNLYQLPKHPISKYSHIGGWGFILGEAVLSITLGII